VGNDETVQISNEKRQIKKQIFSFFDDLIRRNIIRLKLTVKLKR